MQGKYLILAAAFWLHSFSADVRAEEPAVTEIAHLISYLEKSECRFMHNGSWHEAEEAVSHIRRKYEYYLGKERIVSAEDFIEHAATRSSLSGQTYRVKCPSRAETEIAS